MKTMRLIVSILAGVVALPLGLVALVLVAVPATLVIAFLIGLEIYEGRVACAPS